METTENKASNTALVVRYRHWFRSFLDISTLPEFAATNVDSFPLAPVNVFRARLLLGRGPFHRELSAIPQLWFNQGEEAYPTFTAPNVSPVGAALFATHRPRTLDIGEQEAVSVIEASIIHPVSDDFLVRHKQDQEQADSDSTATITGKLMLEAQTWVEKAVGLYALCQYPLVWERVAIEPIATVVDLAKQTAHNITSFRLDPQVPFRLEASPRLKGNSLEDGVLKNLDKLLGKEFHLPLLLLQRTLWQQSSELRFLEAFWLLDYMTSRHNPADPDQDSRKQMFELMSEFFTKHHSEFRDRVQSLKHVVLQAPQRSRMEAYFRHLGIHWNKDLMRNMTTLRNAMAHARPVDPTELTSVEGNTVLLAREVMRLELQARGFCFEN